MDISEKLINAVKKFAKINKIKIGGLYVYQADKTGFKNGFFNILACIGVLEYFDIIYIEKCLKEFKRILKPNSKLVIDFPNQKHSSFKTMVKFENYLKRFRYNLPTNKQFEKLLKKYFIIDHVDSKSLMIKYFLLNN
ncbi:MAG: methyltransferase domain-containing protein [Candidatus Paceibacterota bacterium]|nr:methyltransferase domain-containing protein [Candidatus Paceibacterota bacterium]